MRFAAFLNLSFPLFIICAKPDLKDIYELRKHDFRVRQCLMLYVFEVSY